MILHRAMEGTKNGSQVLKVQYVHYGFSVHGDTHTYESDLDSNPSTTLNRLIICVCVYMHAYAGACTLTLRIKYRIWLVLGKCSTTEIILSQPWLC